MHRRQQTGLFFALFFAYLVLGGREPPWTDARQIYIVAERLVGSGNIDVGIKTPVARDGKSYAAHPFLASALHVPGAALQNVASKIWPDSHKLVRALASHIGPAAVAALLGLLFCRLCLMLGSSVTGSLVGTAIVSFATMVAVYARSPYSEIAQTAAFLGFYAALVAWLERPTLRRALVFGLAAGALCNTKVIFLLALPGAALLAVLRLSRSADAARGPRRDGWREGLLTFWRGRQQNLARLAKHAAMAALGGLPGALLLLGYNYARTRSFLDTGYPAEQINGREFGEWTAIGLWGLFFSLGKSVFLYSPPLIAALFCWRHALATRPTRWAVALAATAGPVILFYGRFTFWHGDWAWGPRYILFAVPPALLPLVFAFDDLRLRRRALANLAATLVFTVGLGVQVLGASFYWDHYIRLAREAQTQWLGRPNRAGATTPDTGDDCGPCLEDMYGLNWLPAFQPIEGHWWLLRHKARHHSWQEAEAKAPWRRYTGLQLDVEKSYSRARIDWWLIDWRAPYRKTGVLLLILFASGMTMGAVTCLRRPRPGVDRPGERPGIFSGPGSDPPGRDRHDRRHDHGRQDSSWGPGRKREDELRESPMPPAPLPG